MIKACRCNTVTPDIYFHTCLLLYKVLLSKTKEILRYMALTVLFHVVKTCNISLTILIRKN